MGFNLGESTKKKGSFNLGDKSDITYVTLTTTDGKEFGDISYRAYRAIENNTLDSYTPINDEEKNLLDKYKKWMEDVQTAETKERQEKIDSYKTTSKEKLADTEKEISTVSDDIYQLRREKAAAKRSTGLLTKDTAEKWKVEDTRTAKEKREGKSVSDSIGTKELKKLESEYAKIDEKADALEETISNIDKYANIVYNDTGWFAQAKANNAQSRLSQDTAAAYNDYVISPTEENRLRADALSALSEQFNVNNTKSLTSDDEDIGKFEESVRDWVSVSLAGYLPQLIDQTKASISGAAKGGAGGAIAGSVVPGVGTATGLVYGLKTGWVLGASKQMYDTTRGMVFQTLIDAGYDEETAIEAANDEAFISSVIEGCGEILSMATLGTGKLVSKIAPNAGKKVSQNILVKGVKEFTEKTGKKISENIFLKTTTSVAGVFVNAVSEYAEEYSQEAVSIANERRLKNNSSNSLISETFSVLKNQDAETSQRLNSAGTEGFKIGLMMGGATKVGITAGEKASAKISEIRNDSKTGKELNDRKIIGGIVATGLNSPENTTSYKLAIKAKQKLKNGEKLSNYEIGKLYAANIVQVNQEEAARKSQNKNTANSDTTADVQTEQTTPNTQPISFKDTKTGHTITVTERNDANTVVQIDTGAKTETKVLTNNQFDSSVVSGQLEVVTTPATENVVPTPVETPTSAPVTNIETDTSTSLDKRRTVAYTNDNESIDLSYKIVDADDLIVSNDLDGKVNPNYPQELQPRDRSRVSSQTQIRQMATELNPARLTESTNVSEGSPIVGADNVVESGNGRTLAIKLAYQMGVADNYRNYIISNADKFGIDVSNLPAKPILVRERMTEVDRTEFTRKANETSIGSLSATEQAKVDAEKLTDDILNLLVPNDEGEINTTANKDFISAVLSRVFKSEDLNNVVNAEGMLSARGLERIKNAIFYKAYGDASLSARLSESLDNDMKNATKVLLNIAPKVVSIKNDIALGNLYDFDFSEDITNAVRLFERCRNEKITVVESEMQTSLFEKESPLVMAMAYVFETKNRGAKQATDFYNLLLDTVNELGNPNQMSLDIFETFNTKEEILDAAVEKFNTGVVAENTAKRVEPRTKNTITIPESIYQSTSETGRENDGRGIDEVSRNESNKKETLEDADRIQQDNRPNEETGVVADDEQLRQKNESVEGQSEVEKSVTETSEYNHIYDEKKVSKEYLDSVNSDIENAIIDIRKGNIKNIPDVITVTELDEKTIKAISDFVGYDISGYVCKIERDRLVHIENRHGINGEHDQSLSDPKDTARMGYVVNNSDTIEWLFDEKGNRVYDSKYNDRHNKTAPVFVMEKRIDGTYSISQVVPDSKKKTLWITSARIEKAAVGSQVPNADNSPQLTPETPLNSSSASDNILSQENDVVNSGENNTLNLTDKCTLTATKRTDKDKKNIWVVSLNEKIPKDKFDELRKIIKPYGGNWSNFTKTLDLKPIPGFMFYSEPSADAIKAFNDFFDNKAEENSPVETNTPIENTPEVLNNQPESDKTVEKPDLKVGDVIEYNGKQWKVKSIGFNMTFDNLDENDKEASFSHIGGMESFKNTHDYNVITDNVSSESQTDVAENATAETQQKKADEDITPDNSIRKRQGTLHIASFVANKLSNNEKISALELSKVATEAFGGTMADNVFTIKDAYDAMELGVNMHILSMKDVSSEKMLEILELLPTQTKRTEEMVKFQQFSTPPSIAYLANYVANVNSNDIMLEPSAGIGGIAVFAKKNGAKVYVNELDNRRLEVLKNMPFDGFFNENAEQLDNILGGDIEPTVIVMNPPFSSSSERNMKNTKIGAKHIEQALKILAPNGRLVAIVGNGMADGAPAFRTWWKDIKSQYNVRANIGVNGKNYNKYGTSFDIQILVIDKNGATTDTITGYVDTLQELQDKLGGIRDARPSIDYSGNEQRTPTTTRQKTDGGSKSVDKRNSTISDTSSGTDNGKSTDTSRNKGNLSVLADVQSTDGNIRLSDNQTPKNADVVDDGQRIDGRGKLGGHTELQDDGRTDVSDSRQDNAESNSHRGEGKSGTRQNNVGVQRRPKRTRLTDSIFEQYQTQPLAVKNAQPHPGRVSESAAMSAIEPPPITYKPNISQDIIDKGVVSDVQLEAISYAGQSHSQVLPNGTTRGFFLGDGTGIGKGRTIAGIMLDNYNQGRKKAVWVTENESLMLDAKRDLTALFGNSDLLMQFEGGKKADKIFEKNEAILAVGYSTLSRGYDKKGSNYEKIVEWLGKDFDGVIVFDEAHNMANAAGKKGKRGGAKPSQTGLAGIALQEALPKARIVYSSATGATEVENLRYAERLGLWGEGTPFVTGADFVSKVKAGGIAAMELVARDMKALGVYLSRNISYDDVKYDKITHNLTAQQTKIYDELARAWQIVFQNFNKALETTNQDKDGDARKNALGAFWGSQQRFFNQILTSMQVPSVIADIEKQLADGKSCVIQLVSTNESAQNKEFGRINEEGLDLEDFDLTPKQMLMDLIQKSFPVQQFEEYRDDNGNVKSRPVYDSQGNHVINREAVIQRDALLDKLGSIKVPSSPIDMIINHFGTDLVAEKTGRSRRVIKKDGKNIVENIANKKDADVDAFQNGNKRIMIFSKAGGTGKSYHADKAAKNQQQRVHYLLEAGWQADKAVQGFGRSHRSNQAVAPIFKLVTTNLKGQMRFISTIAKRLDQLGAMTKGQRQAGGQGMFSASDNLENSLAEDVLAVFYKDLVSNKVDGIDNGVAILEKLGLKNKILDEYNRINTSADELRDVTKFLNRILTLESYEQNAVFDGYSERLQDATEKAMIAGTLDKGLENYKADIITLNEVQDIREDENSGAKTKYYSLTAEHKTKPIKFEDIPTGSKSFVGFYQNKNTGKVRAVMQTSSSTDQYGNVTQNYKLVGQVKNEYIAQHRFYGNWVEIKADEAEKIWNEEISKLPEYQQENLHLISGVVLPVWDKLPTENVRIYRVLTSDGEMLIGRVVSEDLIDGTLRKLGASRKKETIATKDLIAGIKSGDTVYLENDWKIKQSRVSNENRIEIIGPSYEHNDLLTKKGVFIERISYNTRYFVPADTDTEKIIDAILKIAPVMRVENSSGAHYSKQNMQNNSDTKNRWTANRDTSEQPKSISDNFRERVIEGIAKKATKASETTKNIANKAIDGVNKIPGVGISNIETEPVSLADIVKTIREKFDIPIATGKVTSRDASAQYNEKAETIRVRIANDLPDISHELGHHLDKKYGFSNFDSINEVQSVVPQEFLDQYPEREWAAESVGWFVEKYLQSKDNANRLCPDFYTDFISSLSREDLKAINEVASAVNEYMSYDFSTRVRASIVKSDDVKEKTSLLEKAHKAHADWIDGFLPIKDVVEYVENTTGISLSGSKNAYKLATNHLNARAIANFNTMHGFRDLNGNTVEGAKSYIECIANVKQKDLETLDEYLVLKHSLEWIAPKDKEVKAKRVFGDDTLEDIEAIEKRIAEIENAHPEMKEAAENLYEYQRNILKYIVIPAGGMTEATYNSLNKKYPCYVPFYRAIGKDGAKTKGTFANQKSPLKRAKGSGEEILSPLESIIKNTDKMVKFALRNQTMQVLTNYADTVDGFGKFMERVPPDMIPRVIDISKQKEKFADALQQVVSTGEDYFAVSDLFDDIFGDSVTDFTPIRNANKKIVTVMRNGEFSYYQIHDDNLYSAVAEFTPRQLSGRGYNIHHFIMNFIKSTITQNNPVFAASNAVRDIGTAYKHSPINNPAEFAAYYARALKQIVAHGEMYQSYLAMGGGHNSEMSASLDQLKQTLKKISKEKDMGTARKLLYSVVFHPIATTAAINDYVESIPRLAEFMRTLETGGDLQEAIYNSDDITTNFKRSGRSIGAKIANEAFMFNNAALQGLDKTFRTLTNKNKEQRIKTILKWALSALFIAAIESFWNMFNDDEGYENLSTYKKNNFYNFSVGDGIFISIPKARELALLDSFTERTIEYAFGNDKAFYDFGGYLADQLLPPMLPNSLNLIDAVHDVGGNTVVGGILDVGWNKNYLDVPIESKYDTFLPSNERYNEKTTQLAYNLGQTKLARIADLSPKKIDHLISSYLGIIGQANKALFPMNKENRDVTIGLRNKFISDSNYSTDLLNMAYDNTDKAKLNWQYDDNINNAVEYEQNALITSYISGMNKAIKAMPIEEQREGRKQLLKALNNWNYELTSSQSKMIGKLDGESIGKDIIFEELPSSEFSWTVDKQKYTYQMTPQEYNKYISDYLKVIENARKKYGGSSPESYAAAKEAAKDYMSDYKKGLKNKYLSKATKGY